MALVTITADRGDAGQRLDLMLRRHLAHVRAATRTRLQQWITEGRVSVNGAMAGRVAGRLSAGDVVGVELPDDVAPRPVAGEESTDATALRVLYEDGHLLALDKPAGVVVHPTYKQSGGTLLNALMSRARTWDDGQRPSVVGRLDKLTSGIVIVAKSAAVHSALQRALAAPDSDKRYLAVVFGQVRPEAGRIDLPLEADVADRRRRVSASGGARSVTDFELVSHAAVPAPGLSLLNCRLLTGRRHQIRVHLAARGWPIVGDPVYGSPLWRSVADAELAAVLRAFPRQALHAWRTTFIHPFTGRRLTIEAPLPDDFSALLYAARLTTSRDV